MKLNHTQKSVRPKPVNVVDDGEAEGELQIDEPEDAAPEQKFNEDEEEENNVLAHYCRFNRSIS